MISAIGFSQVSGAPTAGTAAALPGAGVGANTGLSVQNGDDNKVRVRQAGTEQSVLTYQDNGSGLGGNLARVRQTGSVSGVSGYQNAAEVNQSGTANQATSVQEGDLNNSIINQGQNDDASSGNKAAIRQGIADQAESNYAATEQDGNDNISGTLQTYDNSDAWTRQIGDENKNMIVQDAGPNGTDGHEAMVIQDGDRNESAIMQSGEGARNIATAEQYGDDNKAKQLQTTSAGAGMVGNRAGLIQGRGSFANVPLVTDLYAEISSVDGAGDDNGTLWGTLPSNGNVAFQTQGGKENQADMQQFGGTVGSSNYGEQTQEGSGSWGNTAAMVQGHFFTGEASNYGRQYQVGEVNDASLGQSGSGHKADQDQRGNYNDVFSSQRGENQILNVNQRGNDNRAVTVQGGMANRALLTQRGGQSYSIEQNKNLGQFDRSQGANQADILQLGPDGDFHADYIECDFDMPMDPTMDFSIPELEIEDICPDC